MTNVHSASPGQPPPEGLRVWNSTPAPAASSSILCSPPICADQWGGTGETDKCFSPAWPGLAAGGRHPNTGFLIDAYVNFPEAPQMPPTSQSLPSAPTLGDSPHWFLLLLLLLPGSTFLAASSLGWDMGETGSRLAAFYAFLWSVKSHFHHQMLNGRHGSCSTLPFLSACFQFSFLLVTLDRGGPGRLRISRHQTGEWGGSRKSTSSFCSPPRKQMTHQQSLLLPRSVYMDWKHVVEMKIREAEEVQPLLNKPWKGFLIPIHLLFLIVCSLTLLCLSFGFQLSIPEQQEKCLPVLCCHYETLDIVVGPLYTESLCKPQNLIFCPNFVG